jgi:endoglucanase
MAAMRGINLGNALDAAPGDEPALRPTEAHLDAIREAGFDAVRIPVRWSAHAQPAAPYALDPDFADGVDRLVTAALDRGLTVLLDLHHYDELHHDPDAHADRFVGLWEQLADRYADRPPALWLELLNEPRAALTAPVWNALLRRTLAAVRVADPARTVVIGPVAQNDVAALDDLDLPTDRHLVATVHYYAPMPFTHQGAHWVEGAAGWLGTTWDGTDAERAAVTADLEHAAKWARDRGVPLLAGEFGSYDRADPASRVRWTAHVRGELDRLGVDWCSWDFGTDFGAYDLDHGAWREPLLRALLPGAGTAYPAP